MNIRTPRVWMVWATCTDKRGSFTAHGYVRANCESRALERGNTVFRAHGFTRTKLNRGELHTVPGSPPIYGFDGYNKLNSGKFRPY